MRYVDADAVRLQVPPDWFDTAEAERLRLKDATTVEERRNRLRDAAPVWQALKQILLAVSSGKCWYCETRSDRAECDVDHFRPKSSVEGCVHPGYFWLATSLENLRVSCQFCNRRGSERTRSEAGGKGNHFPLVDEGQRCFGPDDPLNREAPLLLDPTDVDDPHLLWVDEDGRVTPNPSVAEEGSINYWRAITTIEILNLNEERLRQARLSLLIEVERAERLASLEDVPKEVNRERVEWLVRSGRITAEYSRSVRCLLETLNTSDTSIAHLVIEHL